MPNSQQIDKLFHLHFLCFRILGLMPPTGKYRYIYIIYSIILNIMVTVIYPLHLIIGLFMSSSLSDIIQNLAINLTCLACSLRILVIWLKFQNIPILLDILKKQYRRIILSKEETNYFKNVILKDLLLILKMFLTLYSSSWLLSEVSVLFKGFMGNWNLMYPAYFPFDPHNSTKWYIVAHIYQYVGVTFQIIQGFVIDAFLSLQLGLLSGQIHTLALRAMKLGQDKQKTLKQNNQELLDCIQDHKDLLK